LFFGLHNCVGCLFLKVLKVDISGNLKLFPKSSDLRGAG
jgi:hypothetical protein